MSNTLKYFKEITFYPRPSKKEEKIRNFLVGFFSSKGYKYIIDKVGNLIVYIPAKNSSSKETVILQSHLDMVCIKNIDISHDFLVDRIDFYEKDGFLFAKNTTLGADNGIGIAMSMASVHFEKHPNLELVFTIDEEDGMSGVLGLDYTLLSGTKVINLDSEDENEICISSAGGIGIIGNKKLNFTSGELQRYNLKIFGMKGGHSGVEIDKNRGNAILIFLNFISKIGEKLELYSINAGLAPNVIPREIDLVLGIKNIFKFEIELKNYLNEVKKKYDCPELDFVISKNEENILQIKDGIKILNDLAQIKDGIYTMSQKINGLVQTSMNLGILKMNENILKIKYLARSSDNNELKKLFENTKEILINNGFELDFDRGYPGWQDDTNSLLLNIAKEEFEKNLGKTPKIVAIHAGLECGALVSGLINREVNAISIGPNIQFVHSLEEKVEIASIEKLENILAGILAKI